MTSDYLLLTMYNLLLTTYYLLLAAYPRQGHQARLLGRKVYAPRIKLIADAFRRAQEQNLFPAHFDIDLLIDALYGAVWYKVLIRFEKVSKGYIKTLVDQVLSHA